MSRFNKAGTRTAVRSPVNAEATPSGRTGEGAPGFARDPKSELFLLAVAHMGDGSFYESAPERDQRFRDLVHAVSASDPQWLGKFVPWLRDCAGMRTASVVAAAETAKALLAAGEPGGRQVVAAALQRADEPGELLAYWTSRHGRAVPKPVKRGIADAAGRMYDEFSLLKYDTASHGFRFGDVIELCHPGAAQSWRGELYRHALDRRHGRDNPVPESLRMIRANVELRRRAAEDPKALLDPEALRAAGMTWEDALSLVGSKVSKRELWTALVPILGYFALIRNLRNLDEAGVPDDVAGRVAARIADPEQVRRSRLFPFRFLAAYRAAPSLRWNWPLEQALNASLANVPALGGRTLILVDRSGSMFDRVSQKSGLNRADTAALFGVALALRSEHADLVEFGTESRPVALARGESVLPAVKRFGSLGGTNTADAVRRHYRDGFHSRVVIITDEQAHGSRSPAELIPERVPLLTWNLAGYKHGHGPSGTGTRHTFGGLSDHSFKLIPMLEAGRDARWDDLFGAASELAGAQVRKQCYLALLSLCHQGPRCHRAPPEPSVAMWLPSNLWHFRVGVMTF
jgi:hypothetical protein